MKNITKKIFKDWVTSVIGVIIILATMYKTYLIDFKDLTITNVVVIALFITLGLILFKAKDKMLYDLFKRKTK